jgi:hypothetical protein
LIACYAGRHMIHRGNIRRQSLPFHVDPREGALKLKEPSTWLLTLNRAGAVWHL